MDKKRLTVITKYARTADFMLSELSSIFSAQLELNKYCFEDDLDKNNIEADLFLVSDRTIFEKASQYVKPGSEILVINRTLTKEGYNKLIDIPDNTKAMLVNVNANMAIDTISLISQLGARHIKLTPVFPELKKIPDIDFAITPGEGKYIPSTVNKVLDIGDRVLDISTIIDIIVKFELNNLMTSQKVMDYFNKIVPISFGLERIFGKTHSLESQLDIILKLLDVGIIGVNSLGVINSINNSASDILNKNKEDLIGREAENIFKNIPFKEVLNNSKAVKEKIVKINGWDTVLTLNPIINNGKIYGALAIIKKFSDTEKTQQKLRAQLINKGHVANYTFADITGKSSQLKRCKKIAKRMAKSDSTILLSGETGTGKELFAQAIHNNSNRKNYQFVAVNCAALPENLLESELFGYTKGAFTGAKREGKPGLFELAHKGTLLLDEIGEIPMKLQARLLRVLEERKIMRVGGDRVINVDVRIIAATNRDLFELITKNEFREDLYYRLNILPLRIPPLRDRKEDIFPLIKEFKKEFNTDLELSSKVEDDFIEYEWKGNVRELRNYIEYLTNLKKKYIKKEDLPVSMNRNHEMLTVNQKLIAEFKAEVGNRLEDYLFVLSELRDNYIKNERAGRRSLANAAEDKNKFLTEQEIRSILELLSDYGLVMIKKGRAGTKITKKGISTLKILLKG